VALHRRGDDRAGVARYERSSRNSYGLQHSIEEAVAGKDGMDPESLRDAERMEIRLTSWKACGHKDRYLDSESRFTLRHVSNGFWIFSNLALPSAANEETL
jgi:hypothetical protein